MRTSALGPIVLVLFGLTAQVHARAGETERAGRASKRPLLTRLEEAARHADARAQRRSKRLGQGDPRTTQARALAEVLTKKTRALLASQGRVGSHKYDLMSLPDPQRQSCLEKLGYDKAAARAIVARMSIQTSGDDFAPVTLYRGLRANGSPDHFDPAYPVRLSAPVYGEMYTAWEPYAPLVYALGGDSANDGYLIELRVPRAWVFRDTSGNGWPVLSARDVGNLFPFVSRVGLADDTLYNDYHHDRATFVSNPSATAGRIQWLSPQAGFANNAKYQEYMTQ